MVNDSSREGMGDVTREDNMVDDRSKEGMAEEQQQVWNGA